MNFAIFRNFIQNSFAYISSLEQEKQDPDVMSYLIYFITVTYIQILIQMLVLCEILKADWSVLKWRTTHDFYGSPLRLSENFVNFTEGYFIFTSTYDLYISINSRRFLDIKIICFVTTVAVALCCCPLPCRNRRFCDTDGWPLSCSIVL